MRLSELRGLITLTDPQASFSGIKNSRTLMMTRRLKIMTLSFRRTVL